MPTPGFMVYPELEQQTAMLTDAQLGVLFRGMLAYNRGEEPVFADTIVQLAFSFVQPNMQRGREKYQSICERNRRNGAKGGRPKGSSRENPVGSSQTQKSEL